jgi:hypothetical protein
LIAFWLQRNSGCPFFYWEDEYEVHLRTLATEGRLAALLANDGEQSTRVPKLEASAFEFKNLGMVAPPQELGMPSRTVVKELGARDELLVTLKCVCFLCVCMLVVQVLTLLVK